MSDFVQMLEVIDVKRILSLACVLLVLVIGCSPSGADNPQPSVSPPAQTTTKEPVRPVETIPPTTPSKDLNLSHPKQVGRLSSSGLTVTVQNGSKMTIASLSNIQDTATIPVDRDGVYEIEILLDKRYTVDGYPTIESQTWRFLPDSTTRWVTDEGATVIQCRVTVNDDFKPKNSAEAPPHEMIEIRLPGVKDRQGGVVPVVFALFPQYLFATVRDFDDTVFGCVRANEGAAVGLVDDYLVDIHFHEQYDAKNATVEIETDLWRIRDHSPQYRINPDGSSTMTFIMEPREEINVNATIIKMAIQGVKDKDGQPHPLEFTIYPRRERTPLGRAPRSRYNIVYDGKTMTVDDILPIRQEYTNGALLLVPFGTDNELAGDYHVALHDTTEKKTLFIADLSTFTGLRFWTGWLNDKEFFVGNNYNLSVYSVSGEKRQIFKLTDPTHRNAIHGLGWSTATQTMALLYCDGKTDGIDLVLLTDDFKTTTKVATVDKQDWYRAGGEVFPMQTAAMLWDGEGERLAFTKTKDHTLAIYSRTTGVIQDMDGVNQVKAIAYDAASNRFVTPDLNR